MKEQLKEGFLKKLLSMGLVLALGLSLAACGKTVTNENETQNSDTNVTEMEVTSGGEENMAEARIYDNKPDDSGEVKYELDLDGDFVSLSGKAQASLSKVSWTERSFDVGDDFVVLSLTAGASDNTMIMQFLKINKKTGKQIEKLQYSVPSLFQDRVNYVDVMAGKEGFLDTEVTVGTAFADYVFDLADLAKEPKIFRMDPYALPKLIQKIGNETLDLSMFENGGDPLTQKMVYSVEDGVYVSNYDGTDAKKICDQPSDRDWYTEYVPATDADDAKLPETQNAVYTNPRFFANGTKIACNIWSYAHPTEWIVGFAIIDVATGEVQEMPYYVKGSPFRELSVWKDYINLGEMTYIKKKDENTLIATMVGGQTMQNAKLNDVRYDVWVDINTGEIIRGYTSQTGITADFEVLAIIDSYKGATGKATLYDMLDGTYITKGVHTTDNAVPVPIAVSETYGLFRVTSVENENEKTLILVPIVKDNENEE